MMLDVDFWVCTDFRSRITGSQEIMSRLKGGLAAFVVPAFEFHKQADGVDPTTFPADKEVCTGSVLTDLLPTDLIDDSERPSSSSSTRTRSACSTRAGSPGMAVPTTRDTMMRNLEKFTAFKATPTHTSHT